MEDFLRSMGLISGLALGEPVANSLPSGKHKLGVMIGAHANTGPLLKLVAFLSLRGPVRVLDAGNHYDLIDVAYSIRRATPDLYTAANRIQIVRAFTCIEVLRALQEQKESAPLVIFDMLATFYDEGVSVQRCVLLTQQCVQELNRLRAAAPIVISLKEQVDAGSARGGLVSILERAADVVDRVSMAPPLPEPRLF